LGWIHNDKEEVGYQDSLVKCLQPYLIDGKDERDILVFHDKARDFRYLSTDMLERVLQRHYIEARTWIIWAMDSPLTKDSPLPEKRNRLWQIIKEKTGWLERTIVIVKGECFRQAGANLPEAVSLEGESEKFIESMRNPPTGSALEDLARVGHLIVHFPRQGVLYAREKGRLETSCYYCPNIKDYPNSRELGTMLGFTSILVAAIVRGIAWSLIVERSELSKGIIDGIKQGVILDHLYYLHGYGEPRIIEKSSGQPEPYKQLFQEFTALAELKT
jgi:hypothetical protein